MKNKLSDDKSIKNRIKTTPRKSILALYRLIFEEEGDRKNKSKQCEFSGFDFNEESDEYRDKVKYAARFPVGDLISIYIILGFHYANDIETLKRNIVHRLIDINSLVPVIDETDNSENNDGDSEHESLNGSDDGQNGEDVDDKEVQTEKARSASQRRVENKV